MIYGDPCTTFLSPNPKILKLYQTLTKIITIQKIVMSINSLKCIKRIENVIVCNKRYK